MMLNYIPNCQATFIKIDNTGFYDVITDEGDSGVKIFPEKQGVVQVVLRLE